MTITLSGENSFALTAELRQLTGKFVSEHGDLALGRLDGEENSFEEIQAALTSLPFLSARKMVVLRAPSASKQFVEQAEKLLQGIPETTDLILIESKFDKRSNLYKLLKKITDFHEFNALDTARLERWLVEMAKEGKGNLSLNDAHYLIERVGTNQQILASELEKLLLYGPKITRASIELLTESTPQSTIFHLLDAAFTGNGKRTLELYDEQRALKTEPQQIISMIAWQLHVLALIKTAGERTPDQIAKEAKLNPYVVQKSTGIAKRLSLSELKKMVSDLLIIDKRLKSEAIDPDEALKHYLLNLQ